jgi:hypothetical protein
MQRRALLKSEKSNYTSRVRVTVGEMRVGGKGE